MAMPGAVSWLTFCAAIAVRIGKEKQRRGVPIQDAARERKILARVRRLNYGPLSQPAISSLFSGIMASSRELQKQAEGGKC